MNKDSNYYAFSRPEMVKYVPLEAKKILDIGCSEGNFGKLLKETQDCEIWGIELNSEVAQIARGKLDKVITKDAQCWIENIRGVKFDCVVFNDSLEHFSYPEVILKGILPLLNDNGVVVASIPNIRHLPVLKDLIFNKNWEYKDSGILDNTHMRFFTINSIKTLFNNAGYEIVSIEGINKNDDLVEEAKCLGKELHTDLSDTVYLQFAVVARRINENI